MTIDILSDEKHTTFLTWKNSCDDQFEKYPFNEFSEDLTSIIESSPNLLKDINKTISNLGEVDLLDENDIFGD